MAGRGKDKEPRKKRTDEANRKPKGITKDQNPDLEEGYNTRRIRFMRAIIPKESVDIHDVKTMEERFYRYLDMCEEWDMKVGNLAAYAAMGINKKQAWDWVNTNFSNPARTNLMKRVMDICAMYREGLMEDGKVNPVTGIFWQKNYDGMKDQQEVVVAASNPLGEQKDAKLLEKKYLENTYGIAGQLEDPNRPVTLIADDETRTLVEE